MYVLSIVQTNTSKVQLKIFFLPRNLNFRFFPTNGLFANSIIDVLQRRKWPGHRYSSLPLYHCQTMIFYTMSPVERIDHVRGSLRLRTETLQRIIRCAANIARKFHPLLNNFVASSVATVIPYQRAYVIQLPFHLSRKTSLMNMPVFTTFLE